MQYHKTLVSDVYGHMQLSSLVALINAVILVVILHGHVNDTALNIWFGISAVVSLLRYALAKYYGSESDRFTSEQWERYFLYGVVAAGVTWGMAPFMIFPQESLLHQTMLLLVLAGVSAGATSTLSPMLRAFQIFIVLLMVPTIIKLLIQDDAVYHSVAFLVGVLFVFLWATAQKFHNTYSAAVHARLQYEDQSETLTLSQERFKHIFNEAPVGIFLYGPDMRLKEFNDEFCAMFEAPRSFLSELDLTTLPDQRVVPTLKKPFEGKTGHYEGAYTTQYLGKQMWVNARTSPVHNSKREIVGGVGMLLNITEQMKNQQIIAHQAHYDALTDIPNRVMLYERITEEIARYKRDGTLFALLFLDLDHFKNINDSLGHSVGDVMLVETANRLKSVLDEAQLVARIGGDEFVILLPNLYTDYDHATNIAQFVANEVQQILSKAYCIDTYDLNISCSIGIVLMNHSEASAEDLLKHADTAMYQAKRDGRSQSRFYQEQMDQWVKHRLEISNALRQAFDKGEFELYYQPIVDMKAGRITAAEALIRWHSEKLGDIAPQEFIPVAEENGAIIQIGSWVMREAARQFVQWQAQFGHLQPLHHISINVSTRQFNHTDFITEVKQMLHDVGIAPQNLIFELTESVIVDDPVAVREKMQQLRDLGIGVSIDDFGTGYSSLSYLKKLPFNVLKIDRSFTQDIQVDEDDTELISAILSIAQRFDLYVVAEGVESGVQFDFLKSKACDAFQGYFCSQALNATDFENHYLETSEGCLIGDTI